MTVTLRSFLERGFVQLFFTESLDWIDLAERLYSDFFVLHPPSRAPDS